MNAFKQYGKQMAIYRKWYNFYRKRSASVAYTIDSDKAIFICLHITQDHSYSLPGGGIEKSETAEEAALRELDEEAGVKAKIIELVQTTKDPISMQETNLFIVKSTSNFTCGPRGEWFTAEEAIAKIKEKNQKELLEAIERIKKFENILY